MAEKTVDAYIASLSKDKAKIVSELRAVVRQAAPKATESIKWAQPVYESDGPMIWIKAFTNNVNIGFWRGAEMSDPKGLLEGDGNRMRHVKIADVKDINKKALTDFVKQAVKLNKTKGDPTKRMHK